MKKILFTSAAVLSFSTLFGQFVYDYVQAADTYFSKGDYSSAAEYYEKYLNEKKAPGKDEFNPYTPQKGAKKKEASATTKEQAIYKLAECFRLLNYPSKAEPYYTKALELEKQFPLVRFHYASQLRALGKYPEAENQFTSFLAGYDLNDVYRKSAERELLNLRFIQSQMNKKDLKYYTINKAGGKLNTTGASYAPAWISSNTLMFTSTRPLDSTVKTNKYTNRLFQAEYSENGMGDVSQVVLPHDKEMHQGIVSLTPDGNTLFLTRWGLAGSKKTASIYTSSKTDKGWSDPKMLGETINPAGVNSQQPFVTSDGKYLLFSSDRIGGLGGYDLWYAPLDKGIPGTPLNMGLQINTPYDEQAPSVHEVSKSLIFSSNGRVGMGGLDFFQSKGVIGNWGEPVNMGYPVNSVKDDIYFTSRGTEKNILEDVMLSSDREAVCCLELFALKKIRPLRRISGRIISCDPSKPLSGAIVAVIDTINNKTVYTKTLGADGTYFFEMEDYQPLKVTGEAGGFIRKSIHVGTPSDLEDESMVYPDLCLLPVPPKVEEKFVIENVYYEFDKSELMPESFPALDEIVRMLNTYPSMMIELGAHTDSKGSDQYNLKLSEARAQSVVNYLAGKGIDVSRLVPKGYGESMPIEPNEINGKDNPEGREKNRRTEFKVLKNE